jgi:hypothetical protein
LAAEQKNLEEQRAAQEAKIREEERRQAEELARHQREIDEQVCVWRDFICCS